MSKRTWILSGLGAAAVAALGVWYGVAAEPAANGNGASKTAPSRVTHVTVYPTNALITREVEVPDEVGYVLLRVGAGCVRIDAPPVVEPEGELPMIAPTDEAIFAWRGKIYGPAVDGVIMLPIAAMSEALSHGFITATIDEDEVQRIRAIEHREEPKP